MRAEAAFDGCGHVSGTQAPLLRRLARSVPFAWPPHFGLSALAPFALLALVLSACSESPGGPEYAELGLSVSDSGNTMTTECTQLPVLPGGIIERSISIVSGLEIRITAQRDQVDVTFNGIVDPSNAHRALSADELRAGYSELISVATQGGASFDVRLTSPCGAQP